MYVPPEALPGNQPRVLTEEDIDGWLKDTNPKYRVYHLGLGNNPHIRKLNTPKGYKFQSIELISHYYEVTFIKEDE
jgi:hypothetical protein